MKTLAAYALVIAITLAGCAALPSLPTAGSTTTAIPLGLPNATQLLGACQAEMKAGATSAKAPDCIAYYAIQQTCNIEAIGGAVNPLVAVVSPVAGSVLTAQATISVALCTGQGFIKAPAAS